MPPVLSGLIVVCAMLWTGRCCTVRRRCSDLSHFLTHTPVIDWLESWCLGSARSQGCAVIYLIKKVELSLSDGGLDSSRC